MDLIIDIEDDEDKRYWKDSSKSSAVNKGLIRK